MRERLKVTHGRWSLITRIRLFIAVWLVTFAVTVAAQQTLPTTSAELVPKNSFPGPEPIVVVFGEDSYPFQYLTDEGKAAGLLVDLWREWSRQVHRPVIFVARHWQDALDQLARGHALVHLGMAKTSPREKLFDFADSVSQVNTYLYLHKELENKTTLQSLVPYHIGIIKGSSHEAVLLKQEPKLSFKRFATRKTLFEALENGELKVFAGMEGYLRDQAQQKSFAEFFPTKNRILIKETPLYPAVKSGDSETLSLVNRGFSLLEPEFIQRVERRWLGIQRVQGGLAIAMQLGVEPFVNIGIDGLPHGLYVDMWRLWSEKTGIDIDFIPGDMNGSLADVKNGIADVHIGYPESDDMRSGLKRAWQLYSTKSRLFLYKNKISDLSSLDGLRVGVFPTAPYLAKLKKALPGTQVRFYDSMPAMIQAASRGDIAGFVASAAWTQHYLLANNNWADFNQYAGLEFDTHVYALTRKEDKGLAKRIASGFNLISYQEFAELEQKWMLNFKDHIFTEQDRHITLSEPQRDYLSSVGKLKVGYLKSWPPMEFTDDNGKFAGVNSDMVGILQRELGLEIEAQVFDRWQPLLDALISGDIDLAGSVAKTTSRQQVLGYSKPYWPSPWALVSKEKPASAYMLEQLSGLNLAVVEGYHLVPDLMSQGPSISLVLVPNTQAGIEAVINGNADFFIEKVTRLAQAVHKQDESLSMSILTDFTGQQSHFGISLKRKPLIPLIDLALGHISKQKQQQISEKWQTVEAYRVDNVSNWIGYIVTTCGVLLLILVVSVYLNAKFREERRLRIKAQDQVKMSASYDGVTHLPNRTLLDDRLNQTVLMAAREQQKFAVLFVSLEGLHKLREQEGADVADKALVRLTHLMEVKMRKSDTLAKFSGHEFVVILNHVQDMDAVCQIAEALVQLLSQPVDIGMQKVTVTPSIGVAIYPTDGDSAITLLKKADQLGFYAHRSGGNCYRCS